MSKSSRSAAQQSAVKSAQDAHKIPVGIISREYQVHLPRDLAALFKALSPADRGIAMERGLSPEFPWPEFERLQKFEAAVKTAQNSLGE